MRRWAVDGVLTGLGLYAVLLTIHLAKFRTIAYSVPNIAGWAGSYPGYGWTWELTAINMPADLIDRSPRLRNRGARPQVVTGHGVRFPDLRVLVLRKSDAKAAEHCHATRTDRPR